MRKNCNVEKVTHDYKSSGQMSHTTRIYRYKYMCSILSDVHFQMTLILCVIIGFGARNAVWMLHVWHCPVLVVHLPFGLFGHAVCWRSYIRVLCM